LRVQFPNRFFYFLEHSISTSTFLVIATFLELSFEEGWTRKAIEELFCSSDYQYTPAQLEFYSDTVKKMFANHPGLRDQLLVFTQRSQARGFVQ
jgi:hypothetical protein